MADETANRQLKRTNGEKLIKIYLVEFHTPFRTISNYALNSRLSLNPCIEHSAEGD